MFIFQFGGWAMTRSGAARALWAGLSPDEQRWSRPLVLVIVVGLTAVSFWVLLLAGLAVERDREAQAAERRGAIISLSIERQVTGQLQMVRAQMEHAVHHLRGDGAHFLDDPIERMVLINVGMAVAVTDLSGRILAASGPYQPDATYRLPPVTGAEVGTVIGPRVMGVLTGAPALLFVRRVTDARGVMTGNVVVEYDLGRVAAFATSLPLKPGEIVTLSRGDGLVFYRSTGDEAIQGANLSRSPQWASARANRVGSLWIDSPIDGVERFVSYRFGGDLGVFVGMTRDAVFDVSPWVALEPIGLGGGVTLLALIATVLMIRTLRRQAAYQAELVLAHSVLEASTNGILILDLQSGDPEIVYANPRMRTATGYGESDLIGHHPRFLTDAETGAIIEAALRDRRDIELDVRQRRFDGQAEWVLLRVFFINGDAIGRAADYAVCIGTDIDQRRRVEAELRAAVEEAREASAAKTAFLANISHELRTPLNAILGFTELVVGQPDMPKADAYLRNVLLAGRSLHKMIEELLDVAHLEFADLPVNSEAVPLAPLVKQVAAIASAHALDAGAAFCCAAPDDLPAVWGDALRLKQSFLHLVDNAIKFNRKDGNVTFTAEVAEGAPGYALITIIDTGIGMRREDLARLMQPFVQGDEGFSRKYEGIGIGLFLANRLITQMGGRLDIDSEPKRGTTIRVFLPLAG